MTRTTRRLAVVVALAAGTLFSLTASPPAPAATTVRTGVGAISGVGIRPDLQLAVEATTIPGHFGTAQLVRNGSRVTITLDCVRTYSFVGATLMPIVGGVGYATGNGSDGRRYYLYVTEGFGFEAKNSAGPAVSFDTCGVGYTIPGFGATGIKVTGESTLTWTMLG